MADKFPVKVVKGDDVREAGNVTTLNQLLWDGFVREGDDTAAGTGAKALTRAQKAAATRKAKKAAEAPVVAASGDTAAGKTTVGTNPS